MRQAEIKMGLDRIAEIMKANEAYLTELDARSGDGDLGISMRAAFEAAAREAKDQEDLGKLLLGCSKSVNRAAPSTLGTVLSFWLMGAAKALKGKTEISAGELADALEQGILLIMERAGSKPGEKTILDAIVPAVDAMKAHREERPETVFREAARAAKEGVEQTKGMLPVHGRAGYYAEKGIGLIDGGAVAGSLIFEALWEVCR